ncbi:malonic semialdehyde reductase [Demequina muriae]|uniref:Malonic semialdehyde reductase n=1 Tax=Demequina muriae TaxID=3051664 RepID=A0ABT8GHI4_9MICO|nr:malonic semialdehyde reductase [Demequina sp. EGI L300058]MDN4480877.1 malonic semialdehyde reductase [Demequina sp. EGI L300058]
MPTTSSLDADARSLLFLDARSNVNFADRPVPANVVRKVWELVKWGPTGNNTVPLRLLVAESDEARAAVIANALEGNRAKLAKAPLLVVAAHDERFHDTFDVTGAGTASTYERLEGDPGRRSSMAHSGAMLQAGYFIVGLRAAGLAVRPYGGFDKAAMDAALFEGTSWRSEVLFGIGYPHEDDHGAGERRGRLGADQAVRVA